MNILFDINHPAHVHLFRNAVTRLESQGHNVFVTARDKDVTLELLDNYHISYTCLSKAQKGLLGLGGELIQRQAKIASILRKNKINVCVSATGACSVHACAILGIPSLVFYDTEHAKLQNALTIPFATQYITPYCYNKPKAKNQITYKGTHELAYMHPEYFTPNPDIFSLLNISQKMPFVILRFVSWHATHDAGQKGLSIALKRQLVSRLSEHARVFIVSEGELNDEFKPYQIRIPASKIHDALYYARIFIGEGATMASECACVGTPSIYVNTLKLGYITMIAEKYGLIFDLQEEGEILRRATEILKQTAPGYWEQKREVFLKDHIDVTGFQVNQILSSAHGTRKKT